MHNALEESIYVAEVLLFDQFDFLSSYTQVHSGIYDSGSVPE